MPPWALPGLSVPDVARFFLSATSIAQNGKSCTSDYPVIEIHPPIDYLNDHWFKQACCLGLPPVPETITPESPCRNSRYSGSVYRYAVVEAEDDELPSEPTVLLPKRDELLPAPDPVAVF